MSRAPANTERARAALPRLVTKNRAPPFREMTATEFTAAMEKLGLPDQFSQAQLLRCVISTVNKYANGRMVIPRSVAMLLRIVTHKKGKLTATEVKEWNERT
jgi:hypothetical protein